MKYNKFNAKKIIIDGIKFDSIKKKIIEALYNIEIIEIWHL